MATIKKSFCYLCLADCGINVSLDKQDQIIKITSDFNDPVSQGYICEKAQKLKEHQTSEDRIISPLKKINGNFVEITWEQALDEISQKLKDIIMLGKADRIFYMAPTVAMNEIAKLTNKELMATLGARYCTDIFSAERMHKHVIDSMFYSQKIDPDRKNCQTLIVIGKNPWVTNQHAKARKLLNDIKNDPNRNLIVIDPCTTETSMIADIHIKIKPGTDAWFLSALIAILINDGFIDQNYVDQNLENYHVLQDHFSKLDIDNYLMICGIDRSVIDQLISIIVNSDGLAFDPGNGIDHSVYPYSVFYLLNLLIHITGNYQKQGGMIPIFGFLPDDDHFTQTKSPLTNQMQLRGVTSFSILSENLYIDDQNKFNAVIIDSTNPAVRVPNRNTFKKQLAKIDLVVALDSFHTETTRLADYVLPITTFFENYELVGNDNFNYGHVQLSRPILAKPSFAKHSREIYEELLIRLGIIDNSQDNNRYEEYSKDSNKFLLDLYEKTKAGQIRNNLYILRKTLGTKYADPIIAMAWWYVFLFNIRYSPNTTVSNLIDYTHEQIDQLASTSIVHVLKNIDTQILRTDKKINLTPGYTKTLLKLNQSRIHSDKFLFRLMCGYRQKETFNGLVRSNDPPYVEINIDDAKELGIFEGSIVTLTTENESIDLQARINQNIQSKTLRMPNSPILNILTADSNVDYINPQYKYVFADIKLRKNI